ncbi:MULTISPECIES: hypothetical protein [unclassified Mesorhizobium]|uniref:hypothetical protein n=1 Tax=unclassified Mesorhizobium TaxID=325217 RepID=UPI000BB0846B|nr:MULTISPECIES: hypothetical protein [unclassified Mesorhizobium]PBB27269.1 hypothetical protein CK232_09670 [Mesorhizobium sp. WSM4304]PBB76872.1 hypothetical protein CK227_05365 [Mesorhizobium sp. WSM4308]
MPIIPEIQDRLLLAFPRSSNLPLFRAVQEGIYLADHLFDGESFLNNSVGKDLRGHIRRAGIAHQIGVYCDRGDLPFLAAMKPMPHGSWHWLEIVSTGAVAHVTRTEDVDKFPHESESRQDMRLALQKDLLSWSPDDKPIGKIILDVPKLYSWLTFRAARNARLSHLCWASPAYDSDEWIAHINVLQQVGDQADRAQDVSAVPDPKERVRLKEHIAQALEKEQKTGE